jgi:hypothetical protein
MEDELKREEAEVGPRGDQKNANGEVVLSHVLSVVMIGSKGDIGGRGGIAGERRKQGRSGGKSFQR